MKNKIIILIFICLPLISAFTPTFFLKEYYTKEKGETYFYWYNYNLPTDDCQLIKYDSNDKEIFRKVWECSYEAKQSLMINGDKFGN